jgi:hypothetical protein
MTSTANHCPIPRTIPTYPRSANRAAQAKEIPCPRESG